MSKAYVNQIEPKSGDKITTDKYIQQKGLPHVTVAMAGTNAYVALTAGQVIPFNTIVNGQNASDCYDTSTYKFTAPVSGVYSCFCIMLPDALMASAVYLDINDVEFSRQYVHDSRSPTSINNVYLEAGDTVRHRIGAADSYYDGNASGNLHSMASYTLIG